MPSSTNTNTNTGTTTPYPAQPAQSPRPLPDTPLTLCGGCACTAIRYTIHIPAFEERPVFYPGSSAEAGEGDGGEKLGLDGDGDGSGDGGGGGGEKTAAAVRYPLMLVCHCNDCRRYTGAMVNHAMMCPTEWIGVSLVRRSGEEEGKDREKKEEKEEGKEERVEMSCDEMLALASVYSSFSFSPASNSVSPSTRTSTSTLQQTYLSTYPSRIKPVLRLFCARCGSGSMYAYLVRPGSAPPLPTWVPSLDLYLGSLDRRDLEKVRVDRHVWWDSGVEWAQRMCCNDGLRRHGWVDFGVESGGWGGKGPGE